MATLTANTQHTCASPVRGALKAADWRSESPSSVAGRASHFRDGEVRLIILDWDDTILPSSWVVGEGLRLDEPAVLPTHIVAQLKPVEQKAVTLLRRACELGTVIVITNAETGWVELSAARFLPAELSWYLYCIC